MSFFLLVLSQLLFWVIDFSSRAHHCYLRKQNKGKNCDHIILLKIHSFYTEDISVPSKQIFIFFKAQHL